MSTADENPSSPESGDRDATRYGPTPPADPAATRYSDTPAHPDPAATRYSDTPADPHATVYPPIPPPTSNLLPVIEGYEILGELGKGGMGVVYKARQFTPERLVALKLIRSGQLADEEDIRLFRKEANEAARLDHPNIVPVYEVGEHGGLHFFTMKLVEGGSLNQRLERYRNDPKAAARLVATAARAVHYAHQRQLLHRDLKPGNILLDASGQPHVADFGLAKRLDGESVASQSGAVGGTPEYMAPEQARGEKHLTTAADVYALGGVLYTLLTGRPPFRGKDLLDTLLLVRDQAPTPPSKVRPGVPRDLETICLKCLAKAPARRYGSAEAAADDLARWLKGEPVHGRPVGRMERVRLWCRRNPAVAGLLTAFIAALLLGAAVSTYFAIASNANYVEARRREKDANDQKEEVKKTNAQLEKTLATSLLRPLGQQEDKITPQEIEALGDLASLKREQEGVRLLFVEQALRHPDTTRQLRNRADMAIHAAVGLDPRRRQQVEEMLLARLLDKNSDLEVRKDCVLIGVALDDWSPEFTGAAVKNAVEVMGSTDDYYSVHEKLVEAIRALSPRLSLNDASDAGEKMAEAIAKTDVQHWNTQGLRAKALAALAKRMDPETAQSVATTAAKRAVEAIEERPGLNNVGDLAAAVAVLAPWISRGDAVQIAKKAAYGAVLEMSLKDNENDEADLEAVSKPKRPGQTVANPRWPAVRPAGDGHR